MAGIKITASEIRALNKARRVLDAIEARAQGAGYELVREREGADPYSEGARGAMAMGRLTQAADAAEAAIFRVLNVAKSYGRVAITEDQLHDREARVEAIVEALDEAGVAS